jgi:hypothetical protein
MTSQPPFWPSGTGSGGVRRGGQLVEQRRRQDPPRSIACTRASASSCANGPRNPATARNGLSPPLLRLLGRPLPRPAP